MQTLLDGVAMLRFLLVDEALFEVDGEAADRLLGADSRPTLEAARAVLSNLAEWNTAEIEAALRESLVVGLSLKPKVAFGPVRVAVTGRRVSPPLFESLELLGRARTLTRLERALST
jgi:glutamyl-tRNA synthetase